MIGLSERVALAGGHLQHGPDATGAFVLRATAPTEIIRSIESVHAGEGSLSPSIAKD